MPAFDTSPLIYWLSTYVLCWVVLGLAIRHTQIHLTVSNPVFLISALGLLFLLRLPSIVFDQEISPDESQMIAQAMTLRHDPVYFRSVDGTTGGPLDSYLLVLPSFLGLPFDYITAHFLAFCLIALNLLFLYAVAQRWFGTEAARLALLPVVFLLGFTQHGDFLHYSSELIAVALLSGSYYSLAVLQRQPKPSVGLLVLIGILLGMVPFGKLQGVPLAAVVGLFSILIVAGRAGLSTGQKLVRLGALVAGSLIFPALFISLIWLNGVYDDFVTFYVLANFNYASGSDPIQNLLALPRFFQKGEEFDWFVKLLLGVWGAGLLSIVSRRRRQAEKRPLMLLAFLSTLTLVALYAIIRTGSEYVHYLYFMVGPLLLWLAYGVAIVEKQWAGTPLRTGIPAGMVAVMLIAYCVETASIHAEGKDINHYATDRQGGWRMPFSPVADKVLTYARPGEKLAVWGWRCDYYVKTQMPQGVAENHTIRSVFNHPLRDDYQRRYMDNLIKSFPPIFIDAVGQNDLWLTDRKTQGHEVYPPLNHFIANHYQCVGLVEDSRIYVRNDRIHGRPDPPGKPSLLVEQKHVDKKRTDL